MAPTQDLSPAAKAALMATIAAQSRAPSPKAREAHMRAVILAIVSGAALAAPSVKGRFGSDQGDPVEPASAPPVEPAPKGCDAGWHRVPVVGRAGSHWRA